MVAVKRYKLQKVEVFRNEVKLLCQLRHPHVVSLIGFCHGRNEMIIVVEYMRRGSVSDTLHGKTYVPLCWKQRLKICIGVARGLHYLHAGAKRAVIHRLICSPTILLDDEWSPKLSAFGLSKIGPLSMSKSLIEIESELGGSIGYVDPELLYHNVLLTDKSDAYSFGVVLFELLCGREVLDGEDNQKFLIHRVCECMRNGAIYQAIDPFLKGKIAPSSLQKFLEIAFSCIRLRGIQRPALGEVEATLELALELQNRADSEMGCINPQGEVLGKIYSFKTEDTISTIEDLAIESSDASK
ncbi:hypothetical protein DITRI_Ditri01bG0103800 [Diplodiscus trichospermus]